MPLQIRFPTGSNHPELEIVDGLPLNKAKIVQLLQYFKGSIAFNDLLSILEQNLDDPTIQYVKFVLLKQQIANISQQKQDQFQQAMIPIVSKVVTEKDEDER